MLSDPPDERAGRAGEDEAGRAGEAGTGGNGGDRSGAEETAAEGEPRGSETPLTEEELRRELKALGTKWRRALADLENYKKRVERDRRRRAVEAREDLLLSLVEIADDFERAVASGEDSSIPEDDPYRAGVELILRRVKDVLKKNGVRPIEALGTTFDPAIHEAVAHVDSDAHETDEIIEEVTKGYMVDERPLRCARVVVAK